MKYSILRGSSMHLAILSDIHDNIWQPEKVLIRLEGADALIFCGDFCAPFTLKQIAVNHYPEIARPLAESGKYDAVFYGHDHISHMELIDKALLLNPGEVMGRFGKSTFAWYDTEKGSGEIVEVR